MKHVRQLDDGDEEEEQIDRLVRPEVEQEQGRRVADAEDREHQAPLDFRGSLQEVVRDALQNRKYRQEKESVDRDQDGQHRLPVDPDQPILQRDEEVEGRGDGRMVARMGRRQREELAQAIEGHEREQDERDAFAEEEGDSEDQHHHPPGLDPVVEVADRVAPLVGRRPARQDKADRRCDQQDREHSRV